MMKVSVTIETMMGVNWPMWKRMVPQLEAMGFSAIYRSDHFPWGVPPVTDALELITSLTYLAEHTRRVDFGSLVAPLSVRDPVMLARQAMSIDDLSGGRMILGVGAGWMEEEHTQFGYPLGDINTRIDRFEEALEVITRLVRSADPVSFQGRFYRLEEALLLPRPQQPTRIMIGGRGPKRTLPLTARYADIWNCLPETPEAFQQLSAKLDDLISVAGRAPGSVKRTIMIPVLLVHNPEELQKELDLIRRIRIYSQASDEELLDRFGSMQCILGGPEEVIRKMQAYAEAGVEEFVLQWIGVYNLEGLQAIADEILPAFGRIID